MTKNLFNLTTKFKKKQISKKIVTIYDTHVLNRYYYDVLPRQSYYYKVSTVNNFLLDIIDCLNNYSDLIVIIKRKISNNHKKSKFDINLKSIFENKINNTNRLFIIHNVNIFKSVNISDLVISIPFSSPSIIAEQNKIPSIYYDTTKLLEKPSNDGSTMFINDKNELQKNIKNYLNK